MFKRDIIVNYGSLDELVRQLDTYVNALNDIRSAVKSIMLKIESGKGLAIEQLKEKDSALVFEIDQVQKEILDLKIIIKNYTEEMTNIIKPVVRSNFMQVDRNDIWINMKAINAACQNIYNIPNNTYIWGYNEGYSPFDDEDELADKRRNASNLFTVQRTLSGSKAKFDRLIEKMDSLYKIVKNYENKDDYFCQRAKQLKADNTSFFEGVDDVLDCIGKTKHDFYKGVFNGLKDCALGLKDLLAGGVKYLCAAMVCDATGGVKYIGVAEELQEKREDNIPKWAKTCYTETNDKILAVLHDPAIIGESLAQGASDTLDHQGMAYGAGEVGAVVLVSVAGDKGISKVKSLALGSKVGKTVSKLDDVAGGVSKVKFGSKLDDVAFGGDDAVKIGGVEKSVGEINKGGNFSRQFRASDYFINEIPKKGDVIKPKNLLNELNKSDVGKETIEIIKKNELKIHLIYEKPVDDALLGQISWDTKEIQIYVKNTKTIKETAGTIVHEVTHAHYGKPLNSIKEEFLCFTRTELHKNPNLSWDEKKKLLRNVKELYPELKWRWDK